MGDGEVGAERIGTWESDMSGFSPNVITSQLQESIKLPGSYDPLFLLFTMWDGHTSLARML